jgi:RNA-directed DNA polymerase
MPRCAAGARPPWRRYAGTSGAYMPKFAWTAIVRHQLVRGQASPDDPAQAEYWATRRRKRKPLLDPSTLRLLHSQHGRCPICQDLLLHADREPNSPQEWEQWHRTTRKAITRHHIIAHGRTAPPDKTRLVHTSCLRPDSRNGQETSTSGHLSRPPGLA